MRALFLKIKIDCQDIKKQNILRRKNVILSSLFYHVKVLELLRLTFRMLICTSLHVVDTLL